MLINKITIVSINTVIFALKSDLAFAAENASTNPSFGGWPLLVFIALLVIFRKKIFSEATVDQQETIDQSQTEQQKPETTLSTIETLPEKAPTPKKTAKVQTKTNSEKRDTKSTVVSIDLSDDNQCQASTTKGTRCKRTTTLERTKLTIDNKTYQLIVCSQHNNDKFKPFPELIK